MTKSKYDDKYLKKLADKYQVWEKKFEPFRRKYDNFNDLNIKRLESLRHECDDLADELSDIQHSFVMFKIHVNKNNLKAEHFTRLNEYISSSNAKLDKITYRYLNKLNSLYSTLIDKESKKRDKKNLYLSIFLSTVLSTLIGVGITYWFDSENDNDIEDLNNNVIKNRSIIIDTIKNNKSSIIKELQNHNDTIIRELKNNEKKYNKLNATPN